MKKKKLRLRHLVYAVAAGLLIYTLVNQQIMIQNKKKEISNYTKQYNELQGKNDILKDKIEFAKTNEYKERMARERIGLILPGETVYMFDNE